MMSKSLGANLVIDETQTENVGKEEKRSILRVVDGGSTDVDSYAVDLLDFAWNSNSSAAI